MLISVMPFHDIPQVLLSVTHSMTPMLSTTAFSVTLASHCVPEINICLASRKRCPGNREAREASLSGVMESIAVGVTS